MSHSENYQSFGLMSLLVDPVHMVSALLNPWWGIGHRHEHHWHLMSHPVAAAIDDLRVVLVLVVVVLVVVLVLVLVVVLVVALVLVVVVVLVVVLVLVVVVVV